MSETLNLDTWEEYKKPDSAYGMSYPYITINLNGSSILEKLPFSPYMGKINGYIVYIADISTYKKSEFSIRFYKGNKQVGFKRGLSSIKESYSFAYTHCLNNTVKFFE